MSIKYVLVSRIRLTWVSSLLGWHGCFSIAILDAIAISKSSMYTVLTFLRQDVVVSPMKVRACSHTHLSVHAHARMHLTLSSENRQDRKQVILWCVSRNSSTSSELRTACSVSRFQNSWAPADDRYGQRERRTASRPGSGNESNIDTSR